MKHVEKNMYFPSFALPRKRHFTRRKKEGLGGGREGRGGEAEKRWKSSLSPFSGAIPSRSPETPFFPIVSGQKENVPPRVFRSEDR